MIRRPGPRRVNRPQYGRAAELDANALVPCFCADCMAKGGPARARLRARYFGRASRLLSRNGKPHLMTDNNYTIRLPSGALCTKVVELHEWRYTFPPAGSSLTRADVEHLFADTLADDGVDPLQTMQRSCQGKKRYRSPDAAGDAAAARVQQGAGPLRVYRCAFCEGFHLTKVDAADFAGRAR